MSALMRDGEIQGCMSLKLQTHIPSEVKKNSYSALFDSKTPGVLRIKF